MDTQFLTQFLGIYAIVGGVAMFTNKKMMEDWMKKVSDDLGLRMIGGVLALVFGLAIVLTHNMWTDLNTSIISAFGWIALLKGVFLMVFPPFYEKAAEMIKGKIAFLSIIWLLLGLYLTYIGFFVK